MMTLAPSWLVWSLYFCELSEVIVRVARDHRSEIRTWAMSQLSLISRAPESHFMLTDQPPCHPECQDPDQGLGRHTGLLQAWSRSRSGNRNYTGLSVVKNHDCNEKKRTWTTLKTRASRRFCQYFDTCQLYYGTRLNKSTTRILFIMAVKQDRDGREQ